MKRSYESGCAKRKNAKEHEERIKKFAELTTFSSKITADTASASTNTSRLVSSIAEEKKLRSFFFAQKQVVRLRVRVPLQTLSVNVSEQQSKNTASSDPALWPATNKNLQSYWV
jgi:phosphatidate phosphatase APP1